MPSFLYNLSMTREREPQSDVASKQRSAADWLHEAIETLEQLFASSSYTPEEFESELGSPTEFGELMFRSIPKRSPWDEIVGPVYTTEQVQMIFGGSRQSISDRVKRRTLLRLRTSDRHNVYPAFQFEGRQVLGGLSEILKITVDEVDDWTLASWLVAEQPGLGSSVIDVLRQSGESSEVIDLTHNAVERWSR